MAISAADLCWGNFLGLFLFYFSNTTNSTLLKREYKPSNQFRLYLHLKKSLSHPPLGETPNLKKGFSLVHLNARSIRNKTVEIKLELSKLFIDIILFSETWLNDIDEDNLYSFPRYNIFRHDRISIYRGGGLCAFADENVSCSAEKFRFLNRSSADIEVQ